MIKQAGLSQDQSGSTLIIFRKCVITTLTYYDKAIFLDVGLLCRACGLGITELESARDITLINSGAVAEQFVGQHLLHDREFYEDPILYCWMRQKASSNSATY